MKKAIVLLIVIVVLSIVSTAFANQSSGEEPAIMLAQMDYLRCSSYSFTSYANVKDNYGNIYAQCLGTGLTWHNTVWQEYFLNSQYTKMTGVFCLEYSSRSVSNAGYIVIYGDGNLLYQSQTMKAGMEPEKFTVDLQGIKKMVVNLVNTRKDSFLADAALYTSSESAPEISYSIQGNLLKNGDFSNGTMAWGFTEQEGGDGVLGVNSAGQCKVAISSAGTVAWSLEIGQGDLPLKKGNTYRLQFDASSSAYRMGWVRLQKNGPSWDCYFEDVYMFGSNMRTYIFEFYMDYTDQAAALALQFGNPYVDDVLVGHTILFDNISLVCISE